MGKKFGCLTVLDDYTRVYNKHGTKIKWLCKCDCGNEIYVYRDSLLSRKYEWCEQCRPKGIRNEKIYHIYYGIKARCKNPKTPKFDYYGGKGVSICEEWDNDFNLFLKWSIDNGYKPDANLSIDRIDNDGDYCPENCRWISLSENSARANVGRQKNKSKLVDVWALSPSNEKIYINNIHKFCKDNNLNYSTVSAALHGRTKPKQHGWTFHSNKSRH